MDLHRIVLIYDGATVWVKLWVTVLHLLWARKKIFCTINHLIFSHQSSYILTWKHVQHCQTIVRLWDSYYACWITLTSFNSHPRSEGVYEDDLRINDFPAHCDLSLHGFTWSTTLLLSLDVPVYSFQPNAASYTCPDLYKSTGHQVFSPLLWISLLLRD